jgi:hypothetical protein
MKRRGVPRPRLAALALGHIVVAHVAISMIVLSPRAGEVVPPDSEVVVFAQPTLGGVDGTTFTVAVDGRPLDPRTGGFAPRPVPVAVRVGERATVPMRDLPPGDHRLEITYQPDTDEPPHSLTVDFRVGAEPGPRSAAPKVAAIVVALILLGGFLARRRTRLAEGSS